MLNNYMGILTLNENDDNIRSLSRCRQLASIPFAGRYRIIDFVLSNMVNAGLRNIGLFTHSKSRSLMDHLGSGKPWDLDRKINGLFIFNVAGPNGYMEEIETFKNNIEYLYQSKEENVILSSSYMICNIDYRAAARYHEKSGKDITIIYKKVADGKSSFLNCNVLSVDSGNKVVGVGKNIGIEDENNISMEMFIMKKEILLNLIFECIKTGFCTTLKDAVYRSINRLEVGAYEFTGYLACINSINSYYRANKDLLNYEINKELFSENGPIFTKTKDEAPTKYGENAKVSNSLIANGCIIEGTVENCILFRRVKIRKGAQVKNCIIMQNSEIRENASLTNIITDKNIIIDNGKELKGDDSIPLVIEKKPIF